VSRLRGAARAAALVAWTALAASGLLLAHTMSGKVQARALRALSRAWARGTARIIGLRITAVGAPPTPPFLLVANHLSYLDVIVMASQLDADFVAKADVAAWPLVGSLCRRVQTVFIDRTRKRDLLRVLSVLERRVRAGSSVVLFPEGTTSEGRDVLPFKSSLFEVAVRTGQPTHMASLTYVTPSGAPHPSLAVCWWGDMTFVRHVLDVLRLPRIDARLEFAPLPLLDRNRKRLARAAHGVVRRRFQPVSGGESPCPLPTA
jgi:1-acyl-sn-glycerol-3-phosphate acyltransferase